MSINIFWQGDSGGGLVARNEVNEYVIVGIASWALFPCAEKATPYVFTNVLFFNDWIDDTMKNN